MRAVLIDRSHAIDIVEVPVPAIGAEDVLVKPAACGICGTDLHILKHGFVGTNYPVTPGHEFAGYVVVAGRDVRGVKEGDFVAVDPNVVCGHCRWCRQGRPNLCDDLSPIGVGRAGAAAEFVVAPARNAHAVRESIGHGAAALIEPLACVLHAVESAQSVKNRNVLVMGAGTMGLLIAMVCRHVGAGQVTVADPVTDKHALARRAGIETVVDPKELGPQHYEVVFEAAGVPAALQQALGLVEKSGVLVQVGVHDAGAMLPIEPFRIYERELRIIGSNSLAGKFAAAVDLMTDIHDRAALIIGSSFPVWRFAAAVERMTAGHAIKTQLVFD
jgi:2-desacetyl-2-hydroxyethyl bacteriochlorophyllide A dehydrogenase